MQGDGRHLREKRKPVFVELLALLRSDGSGLPRRTDFRAGGSCHVSHAPLWQYVQDFVCRDGADSPDLFAALHNWLDAPEDFST